VQQPGDFGSHPQGECGFVLAGIGEQVEQPGRASSSLGTISAGPPPAIAQVVD
jgi:hypothetical protein